MVEAALHLANMTLFIWFNFEGVTREQHFLSALLFLNCHTIILFLQIFAFGSSLPFFFKAILWCYANIWSVENLE